MYLRQFNLDDFEEVIDMYYAFIVEVFGSKRKVSPKYFFYKKIIEDINNKKHIILSVNNAGAITGMSICYKDSFDSLTEPIYHCETCYVKPEYRNTRAGYLLYNNGSQVAEDLGLNLVTNGRIENGTSKMMEKHFSLNAEFINYERRN